MITGRKILNFIQGFSIPLTFYLILFWLKIFKKRMELFNFYSPISIKDYSFFQIRMYCVLLSGGHYDLWWCCDDAHSWFALGDEANIVLQFLSHGRLGELANKIENKALQNELIFSATPPTAPNISVFWSQQNLCICNNDLS